MCFIYLTMYDTLFKIIRWVILFAKQVALKCYTWKLAIDKKLHWIVLMQDKALNVRYKGNEFIATDMALVTVLDYRKSVHHNLDSSKTYGTMDTLFASLLLATICLPFLFSLFLIFFKGFSFFYNKCLL